MAELCSLPELVAGEFGLLSASVFSGSLPVEVMSETLFSRVSQSGKEFDTAC